MPVSIKVLKNYQGSHPSMLICKLAYLCNQSDDSLKQFLKYWLLQVIWVKFRIEVP